MKFILLFSSILFAMSTCNIENSTPTIAEQIVFDALEAHGGDNYNRAYFKFIFRNKNYTFKNNGAEYEYTLSYEKDGKAIYDVMNNNGFIRTINSKEIELTEKQINGYSESLNSVIYFATLPHKLIDKAVNKSYIGVTKIKNQSYDIVEVTFNQEGGGKDFDDTYYYWINQKTKIIDYLAYNYTVNNGGVRFRSAYNGRVVGSILFQDYINYKAEVGTPLKDLPALYEAGQLKELSKIETEQIEQLNINVPIP